nr:AlNc14C296G10313 [Albugo laibachii Nc14]|eukprot:CCA25420.1 AlNc14C296G10313 [Albugo laibachii Nc14]
MSRRWIIPSSPRIQYFGSFKASRILEKTITVSSHCVSTTALLQFASLIDANPANRNGMHTHPSSHFSTIPPHHLFKSLHHHFHPINFFIPNARNHKLFLQNHADAFAFDLFS